MTAQIPDRFRLGREHYDLCGVMGGPLFDPRSVGIEPQMMSTACWRGFVCTYSVRSGRLFLSELLLSASSETDPGEPISKHTDLFGVRPVVANRGSRYRYRGSKHPVPFSGGLLLGKGFIQDLYVHMGFHPAWKYEQVVELILRDGEVLDTHNHSASIAEQRRQIEDGGVDDPNGAVDAVKWIERTFTLDYSRSWGDG